MPVRQALGERGIRTIFNILGPLINPGRPSIQLLGVFSRDYVEPLAAALHNLGLRRGLVVHTSLNGDIGMDELACCGTCHVAGFGEFVGIREKWMPDALGLDVCSLDDVQGGDLERNMEILDEVLGLKAKKDLSTAYASTQVLHFGALVKQIVSRMESNRPLIFYQAAQR